MPNRQRVVVENKPTKLLICGTGRCGTGYVAMVLRAAGLFCGHETKYTPEAVLAGSVDTGEQRASASWLAAPLLPIADTAVVHLVRHPLAVVQSQLAVGLFDENTDNVYVDVVRKGTPEVFGYAAEHDRALAHWVAWNKLIAPHAALMVPLDDLNPTVLQVIVGLIGERLEHPGAAMRSVPKRYNAKEGHGPVAALRRRDFDPSLGDEAASLWASYADDWQAW